MYRRNPNEVYAGQVDIDTRDYQRGLEARERLLFNQSRLIDDRRRTIGVDISALNHQISDKAMKMGEAIKQRNVDLDVSNTIQEKYRLHLSENELNRCRKSREYAAALEAQCQERRMKDTQDPDFDPKYLIGNSLHPRDDFTARRCVLKAHQTEVVNQILNKPIKHSESNVNSAISPIRGDIVKDYRERVNASFLSGNKAIIEQRQSHTSTPILENVSLPESTPHGSATDFRGFSKEQTRQLLDENDALIASKKEQLRNYQLDNCASRLSLESAARADYQHTQDLKNQKRQIQKECVSISMLNSELRNQASSQPTPKEYFVNRFGTSLIYSLLE